MFGTIVLAGLMFFPFALAQTGNDTSARVRGTVTTGWPAYHPVPHLRVVAVSDGAIQETRTDANGRYLFLSLLPGVYRISTFPENADPTRPHPEIIIYGPSASAFVARAGAPVYVGTNRNRSWECVMEAESPVELSAGLEYLANIDLVTHCQ